MGLQIRINISEGIPITTPSSPLNHLPTEYSGSTQRQQDIPVEPHSKGPHNSNLVAGGSADNANFGDIQISHNVSKAILRMGYRQPTPIQIKVIPELLAGKDVVGQSQTGTGKTAAFGIPLIECIDASLLEVQALILTPTRELAKQVSEELWKIGQTTNVRVLPIYGGQNIDPQIRDLRRGVHIVVGTPGRILDHLKRDTLSLRRVKTSILDEADKMLDIGFKDDIEEILGHMNASRQTALFSATMPAPIKHMVNKHLKSPTWIIIGGEAEPLSNVEQIYYEVAMRDRNEGLKEVLRNGDGGQTIVFCRTQIQVDRLYRFLERNQYPVTGIHGSMTQTQRDKVMKEFRSGKSTIMVATNLASRGLDIPSVNLVINYDIPQNLEEYVHRIGRTGRMGRNGKAITFLCEWDLDYFDVIQQHFGNDLRKHILSIYGGSSRKANGNK